MREEIEQEIRAIRREPRPQWARIGQLLDMVESGGYWRWQGAGSFSEWVRALAITLGCQERILWRYLTAARFYKALVPDLTQRGFDVQMLEDLPGWVSPASLELLSRLARVAPREIVDSLAIRVVTKQITRAELLQAWQAFRPALAGWTARGRGDARPPVNRLDPPTQDLLRKAGVIHALQSSGGSWTGCSDPDHYRVLPDIWCAPARGQQTGCLLDAVAVVGSKDDPLVYHGIEYVGANIEELTRHQLRRAASYCDYLWAIEHEEAGRIDRASIPASIGVLLVREDTINVVRPAKRRNPRFKGRLTSALFVVLVRRWPHK